MEKIQNGTYSASNTIKLNDKLIQVNAKIEVKINSEITENDYYKNKWRQIVKTKIIPNLIRQKNMEKLNSPYNIRRQSVVSYDSNISPALTPKLSPRRKSRRLSNLSNSKVYLPPITVNEIAKSEEKRKKHKRDIGYSVMFSILGVISLSLSLFLYFIVFQQETSVIKIAYEINIICNETLLPLVGDGICDDEINERACEFDLGDCCMKSEVNLMNCMICQCYESTTTTEKTCPPGKKLEWQKSQNKHVCKDIDECIEYDFICGDKLCKNTVGNYECYDKAVVYYSPQKGALYVYKSYLTSQNTTAILKCYRDSYNRYQLIDTRNQFRAEWVYDIYKQNVLNCGGEWYSLSSTLCQRYYFKNGNVTSDNYFDLYSLSAARQNFGMKLINGTYYAFGGLFKQVLGTEAYAFTRSDWENFEFGFNAGFEGQPPPPDYAGDDVPMLDYLNSLPESIAFMCTVVLRGYEVYIIGGRNDYGPLDTVYVYNTLTRNWILKPERLPFPIYEHGCIVTISKITGKQIILLAGGLEGRTVKLPLFNGEFVELPTHEEMEHTYFLDTNEEASGWQILGGKLPLKENPSLIHTGVHLMALGDCRNNSEDIFACDYTKDDGLYFFDWAKLQWINHQVTTLSHGNKGSRAFHVPEIDVFGSPIISEIQCTNIKWPKCIEYGVDYVPVSGIEIASEIVIQMDSQEFCADYCQDKVLDCYFWVFKEGIDKCVLKLSPNYMAIHVNDSDAQMISAGRMDECFHNWPITEYQKNK